MKEYISNLNEKQLEACEDSTGPSLIIAGAGSGKTRVLTYRIAYLINEKDVNPFSILAITFTNKAANEMKERLITQVGLKSKKVTCMTFHSFCAKLLRQEITILPDRKDSFQIIDDDETESLVKQAMIECNIDVKAYKPKAFASSISSIKSRVSDFNSYDRYYSEQLEKVMSVYNGLLFKNNLLDFDDLILLTITIFEEHKDILEKYQNRYQYILVDEFQDTSNIQYDLVKMLGEKSQNVFIVGDEDQSIYSFRGANINNINKFMRDFPKYHKHVLDQNYRSTKAILSCANALISHNKSRIPKDLWTISQGGDDVTIYKTDSDKAEAREVVEEIERLVKNKEYDYKDIAILYRNNSLSRNFEDKLIQDKIPYRVYSGLSFYKRKEVKDMISYLRLAVNPDDFYAFRRVVNSPKRHIGDTTISKIQMIIDSRNVLLSEAVELVDVSRTTKDALLAFRASMLEISGKINELDLGHFFDYTYTHSGYKDYIYSLDSEEKEKRESNIEELYSSISEIESIGSTLDTLIDYLQNITLKTDEDIESQDPNHVHLMTMHSAKGLEFKVVFVTCLERDIIPGMRVESIFDVEEERRIFYVAITRAMKKLYLSYSSSRYNYGQMHNSPKSPFIEELPIVPKRNKEIYVPHVEERVIPKGSYKVGERISHSIFGPGVIQAEVEGFYIIKFDNVLVPKKVIVNHPLLKKE